MAYWHEPKKNVLGWVFPPYTGRVRVRFEGENARIAPFEGYFLRYEGEGLPPDGPRPYQRHGPAGWFVLRPREPIRARSMEEAKAKVAPLLPLLKEGRIDDQFTRSPYVLPARPDRVKEVEHAEYVAKAVIAKHPDGPFEVKYFVYAPNGRYFPAATPSISSELEWEWGVTWPEDENGNDLRTLADDLASAEEMAALELDAVVRKDPKIRRRADMR